MTVADLIPFNRGRTPAARRETRDPLLSLRTEMDRLFDDFFDSPTRFWRASAAAGGAWPSVDVTETENEVIVQADVPGMSDEDIEVLLEDNVLTLRGEKLVEDDHESRTHQLSERFYGRFERRIPLLTEVDPEKVSANFKNGELTVRMPISENARGRTRRIPISS